MPRRLRVDAPRMLHHVFNRGIARRTVFETRQDIRHFLALLACQVRAGRIEILAYSILTTHFHLVVRSTTGELPRVMQWVMNRYVRYFNRTRKRDGPLFRSRYRSIPVRSARHLFNLFRYLDRNAPEARLVHPGELYPFGSERWYVGERRPRWLSTEWADEQMGRGGASAERRTYRETFGRAMRPGEVEAIELRMVGRTPAEDDWDSLVGVAPERVQEWMVRKARLADGTRPGLPCTGPGAVAAAVQEARDRIGRWVVRAGRGWATDGWSVAHVGLLRDLCGLAWAAIARITGGNAKLVERRATLHRALLLEDDRYAARAAGIAARALADA